MNRSFLCLLAAASLAAAFTLRAQSPGSSDWGYYGGDALGQHFSTMDQINRTNVARLEPAWTYRTGELGAGFASARQLTFEATPVLAFGLLYLETATNVVIALDPESGRERWRFDPHVDRARRYAEATARGVSLWAAAGDSAGTGACRRRVFTGTLDARLLALDADTGQPCAGFGENGQVDLTRDLHIRDAGAYLVTSPPAVFGKVVMVGSAIGDNRATAVERGVIRGYDAESGAQLWSFDPLPDSPAHPAAAEWNPAQAQNTGAANAWGVMTVDQEHGLVLVPTGSASPDYFGGERLGSNRLANSLLALDAHSGRLVWQQQLVHHDLWDYDLAAQPVLGDVEVQGVPVPAVLQATKSGMLYVFERSRGRPLFPITERAVPGSRVPGEQASPTQPFSSLPPLTSQRPVVADDAWGLTVWDRYKCRELIRSLRNEGIFTPPDLHGTLLVPGYIGGVNWGGLALDQDHGRVIAAVNLLPMVVTLLEPAEFEREVRSGDYPHSQFGPQTGAPYAMRREPLLSPWGLPCTAPPWGALVSIDLRHNRLAWQSPLGSTEGFTPWFLPVREFGMPNMGGPIATAGGLVFVAAAMDGYLRAFDSETGAELWRHKLPAGGQATPMTYRAGISQRQYVVISAGGHGPLGTPRGDYVMAFALPAPARPAH
ncbi:MAG: pyrroloquinoline quinone-dependent dehydrogenase [Gammaproteobacteria bacterium]|nr:pyrroloquinoline quinone-dependent dehydrogenase [Gammaproteobacteria bacterium]MBV8308344.1 pyrroloquinoline quinone-dependent dehydrogenase [Gammaproteobacteria bacterium]